MSFFFNLIFYSSSFSSSFPSSCITSSLLPIHKPKTLNPSLHSMSIQNLCPIKDIRSSVSSNLAFIISETSSIWESLFMFDANWSYFQHFQLETIQEISYPICSDFFYIRFDYFPFHLCFFFPLIIERNNIVSPQVLSYFVLLGWKPF